MIHKRHKMYTVIRNSYFTLLALPYPREGQAANTFRTQKQSTSLFYKLYLQVNKLEFTSNILEVYNHKKSLIIKAYLRAKVSISPSYSTSQAAKPSQTLPCAKKAIDFQISLESSNPLPHLFRQQLHLLTLKASYLNKSPSP